MVANRAATIAAAGATSSTVNVGERGGGRPRAPREDHRHEPQQARPEPREQPQAAPVAPIARIEEARHRHPPARPPREPADDVGSHLPAFLLRPVRGKA